MNIKKYLDCQELLIEDVSNIKGKLKRYLENFIDDNCVHGQNILKKIKDLNKNDNNKIEVLCKTIKKYKNFIEIMNSSFSQKKIKIKEFIHYREYIKSINKNKNGKPIFSAQSKFESTILEEFLYHLFKDFKDENIKVGSVKSYSSFYFSAKNFQDFKANPIIGINEKEQDFAIYRKLKIELKDEEEILYCKNIAIPVIAIECKTYLDKTMLEGSIATAEKIKMGNPYCKFFILTESYDVSYDVDISNSRIDNIFILRKGRTVENNNIDSKVIEKLYEEVMAHLKEEWGNIKEHIHKHGVVFI